MLRFFRYAVLPALALSLAACGGGQSPSKTVNKYHQAILDGDVDTVMALSSSTCDRELRKSSVDFRQKTMSRIGLPPIVKEEVDGSTAVVTCKFGPVEQGVDLVKEDGQWKIK